MACASTPLGMTFDFICDIVPVGLVPRFREMGWETREMLHYVQHDNKKSVTLEDGSKPIKKLML